MKKLLVGLSVVVPSTLVVMCFGLWIAHDVRRAYWVLGITALGLIGFLAYMIGDLLVGE